MVTQTLAEKFDPLAKWGAGRFLRWGGADYDDAVQELRIVLLNAERLFRPDDGIPFKSFAGLCIVNHCRRLAKIRRRGGFTRVGDSRSDRDDFGRSFQPASLDEIRGIGKTGHDLVGREDADPSEAAMSDDVWAAVRRLPTREQQAIHGYYVEGLKYRQLAARMRCTRQRVCQLVQRGIERLRDEFGVRVEACA